MIKYDNFENLTINKHANRQGVSCDYPSGVIHNEVEVQS